LPPWQVNTKNPKNEVDIVPACCYSAIVAANKKKIVRKRPWQREIDRLPPPIWRLSPADQYALFQSARLRAMLLLHSNYVFDAAWVWRWRDSC